MKVSPIFEKGLNLKFMVVRQIIIIFISIFSILPANSQTKDNSNQLTRILFILDCSHSMAGTWQQERKIKVARKFLSQTIDSLENIPNVEMALRVYGHQSVVPPQDCSDTKLEVPFAHGNGKNIKHTMQYLNPKGTTPIAYSLELAGNDFPECSNCRNIIILITDGVEACEGDPCEISRQLQKKGIFLEPFIIGIGIDPEFKKSLNCAGTFIETKTETSFKDALDLIITKTFNRTTAQVNLLDSYGYPSETNVNMTFFDINSGKIKYNFVHAINHRGNPDTIYLDPLLNYRMVVHTLPPVTLDSINLNEGKHNILAVDAPRGDLIVKPPKGNQFRDLEFVVRKSGKNIFVNSQKINNAEKYIVGKYDIEIPTLPRLNLEDVVISQNHTTTINIPRPGMITLRIGAEGYCGLFIEKNNSLEWIYNIDTKNKATNLVLLPGNYRIIYKPKSAGSVYSTIEKSFKIEPGKSGSMRIL